MCLAIILKMQTTRKNNNYDSCNRSWASDQKGRCKRTHTHIDTEKNHIFGSVSLLICVFLNITYYRGKSLINLITLYCRKTSCKYRWMFELDVFFFLCKIRQSMQHENCLGSSPIKTGVNNIQNLFSNQTTATAKTKVNGGKGGKVQAAWQWQRRNSYNKLPAVGKRQKRELGLGTVEFKSSKILKLKMFVLKILWASGALRSNTFLV